MWLLHYNVKVQYCKDIFMKNLLRQKAKLIRKSLDSKEISNAVVNRILSWDIFTKSCNIVTPDTVSYMSPSRMENILMKDYIVYDRIYAPFIETIVKLREQNKLLEEFNDPE